MATCKTCLHYGACAGYLPSDLNKDIWIYCAEGRADEIPDIDERCSEFKLDHRAQLRIAWDEFKQDMSDEFTNSKIGNLMYRLADKLAAFLERGAK